MAQSDQTIQNAAFPTVRADINDNLAAIYSQNSGASAPSTTVAFQPWVDTSSSPPVWKIRNAANSAWITVGVLDSTNFQVGGVSPIANGGTGQTTAIAALNALLPSQSGHSGDFLKSDGTNVDFAGAATGVALQVFTSNTTYTPTSGKVGFLVLCQGGGGGAGGSEDRGSGYYGSSGGGAGGCAIRVYNTTEIGANAAVTVGGGGSAGHLAGDGSSGSNSTFNPAGTGATLTGGGGGGSTRFDTNTHYSAAGTGGGASGGQLDMSGQMGSLTQSNPTRWVKEETSETEDDGYNESNSGMKAAGGASFFAGGAGSGGNGSWSATDGTGGAGNAGVVMVLEF